MTLIDGEHVHVVVPSKAPICPTWNVAAGPDEAATDNFTADARNSAGNSPTIAAQATNRDGRRPECRTTLP
jgi:hypothetical protein